jgi:hypothetical protein
MERKTETMAIKTKTKTQFRNADSILTTPNIPIGLDILLTDVL